jgi:hypothetical protein
MGSTFWAESYFRSLKRTKVLSLFTKYLLQYKRVSIPNVGTFEIVQQSPQLNIAEKLFLPPFFIARYRQQDAVTDHQRQFFAVSDGIEKTNLEQFGARLKTSIERKPFRWNGFGILRYDAGSIVFEPDQINIASLNAIPAHKVTRENAQHSMLVGDQQMTSQEVTDVLSKKSTRRPLFMIIGWAVLVIAMIAILIILYLGRFEITAAGLQTG